jgi:hypothetical protein
MAAVPRLREYLRRVWCGNARTLCRGNSRNSPPQRSLAVGQLALNPISNNVGGVKQFSSTLLYALTKSAISLSKMVCAFPTWARFESLGSGTQSDPAISSIPNCDHDYLFKLPSEGSGSRHCYGIISLVIPADRWVNLSHGCCAG